MQLHLTTCLVHISSSPRQISHRSWPYWQGPLARTQLKHPRMLENKATPIHFFPKPWYCRRKKNKKQNKEDISPRGYHNATLSKDYFWFRIIEENVLWPLMKMSGIAIVSDGLRKELLSPGSGNKPSPGDTITVHCTGCVNGNPPKKFWR